MGNSLKTKEKLHWKRGLTPPAKDKTKSFLIYKELKTKDLRKIAAGRGKRTDNKTQPKTPDSLRQEASQAANAAPTLRYGPAGDSAPRLRLKTTGMAESSLSARPHGPETGPSIAFNWGNRKRRQYPTRTESPQEKTGKPDRKTQESGSRRGGRSNSSRSRSRSRKPSSPFMRRALRSGSVWVTCSM